MADSGPRRPAHRATEIPWQIDGSWPSHQFLHDCFGRRLKGEREVKSSQGRGESRGSVRLDSLTYGERESKIRRGAANNPRSTTSAAKDRRRGEDPGPVLDDWSGKIGSGVCDEA